MAFNKRKDASLPPVSKRHKAALILICRHMARKQRAHLEEMIKQNAAAYGIRISDLTDQQIEETLNITEK